MPDDSYESKWNRLQKAIQHEILTQFPNPDRKGCPGIVTLHSIAVRAHDIFDDSWQTDPNWHHITHCSPCYAEYLQEFEKLPPPEVPTPEDLEGIEEEADSENGHKNGPN
jgi:hypothetical protein